MITRFMAVLGVACLLASTAAADSLELKDGTLLQGRFVGGTAQTVRFQIGDDLRVLSVSRIRRLVFGEAPAAPATPSQRPADRAETDSGEPAQEDKPSEAAPLV